MKLLHVSDVHCAVDNLRRLLEEEDYDAVAATGDFECIEVVHALTRAKVPVFAVSGNVDSYLVVEELERMGLLLDGKMKRLGAIVFAGIGGRDPLGDAESLMEAGGDVDVVLSHYPPRGVLDETYTGCRGGLEAVKEAAERLRPRLLLCGHIHEARGVAQLGSTTVVNAGPLLQGYYAVVEMPTGAAPRAVLRRLH